MVKYKTLPDAVTGEVADALRAVSAAVDVLDAREPCSPSERISRWHHTKIVADALAVVLGQMEVDAVAAMDELGLSAVDTDLGPVHTEPGYSKEQWDGAGVLSVLGQPLVDRRTGEVVDAVPVSVLRDVLPAVGEGSTSSKWRTTGLVRHGVAVARYRNKTEAPLVMRLGSHWQR